MNSSATVLRQEFRRFSVDMVHSAYPGINLCQLEKGSLQGWVFSAEIGAYHLNAGSFNRVLLYEGEFNPNQIHLGLIFSLEHTAVVQAHVYDSGNISIDMGSVYMHNVLPANMVWVNIYTDESTMMSDLQYSKKELHSNPHIILAGERKELEPLVQFTKEFMRTSIVQTNNLNQKTEKRLKSILHRLLESRLAGNIYDTPYALGDKFRMQLLSRIDKLYASSQNRPLSLEEICAAVQMKRRTIQKYFHDIYGMGPTEYFRVRRLNGARFDLMKGSTSVSQTALYWGFHHFGRFAANYKKLFNESPKTTIEYRKKS